MSSLATWPVDGAGTSDATLRAPCVLYGTVKMADPGAVAHERDALVSVIIPAYNRAELLAEAVDSAIGQTYPRLEIIVVDDGSTDDTPAVLAGYGSRIKPIFLDHGGLPARARNAGIRAAAGEFLAFLDADDRWVPEKTRKQLAVFAADPEVGLVCANAEIIDVHGRPTGRPLHSSEMLDRQRYTFNALVRGNALILSAVMCRSAVVNRAGGFFESQELRVSEDYDLWLRCAAISKVVYLRDTLTHYRVGRSDQLTADGDSSPRQARAWLCIHDRITGFLETGTTRRIPRYSLGRLRLRAFKNLLSAAKAGGDHAAVFKLRLRILRVKLGLILIRALHGKDEE